jgi:hypothetical protein
MMIIKELTIEKLVPLLTSSDWRKRLVGEYYEIIVRVGGVKNKLEALYHRFRTIEKTEIMDILSTQSEIDQMLEQLSAMKQYESVLFRRLAQYGILYTAILDEALDEQKRTKGGISHGE